MSSKRLTGMTLAAAAAAIFAATPMVASAGQHAQAEPTGHCVGSNSCKGQSACATANSSCKGQNACQGQGFEELTRAECEAKEGTFEEA